MFKATFNCVKDVTVNVKPAFYKKAIPTVLQQKHQIVLGGLTEEETHYAEEPFTMKIVGLFTGSFVESVKIEEENFNGNA